jgi:hypothetical protein
MRLPKEYENVKDMQESSSSPSWRNIVPFAWKDWKETLKP